MIRVPWSPEEIAHLRRLREEGRTWEACIEAIVALGYPRRTVLGAKDKLQREYAKSGVYLTLRQQEEATRITVASRAKPFVDFDGMRIVKDTRIVPHVGWFGETLGFHRISLAKVG